MEVAREIARVEFEAVARVEFEGSGAA